MVTNDEIWEILNESDFELKFEKFKRFYAKFQRGEAKFNDKFTPQLLEIPSYAKICKIVKARNLPKFSGKLKIPAFLHSILHIEYSAIDIALDDCYRFCGLPNEFYADFLEVASDEFRHFSLINAELSKFGYKYGDFSVQDGLFFMLRNTQNSLLERMAVMHKFSEANGLDANYFLINRIKTDPTRKALIPLLQTILDEEISHVAKGNKWFKFECERLNLDEICFFEIVQKYYPNFRNFKRQFNINDRLKAGFSANELKILQNFDAK